MAKVTQDRPIIVVDFNGTSTAAKEWAVEQGFDPIEVFHAAKAVGEMKKTDPVYQTVVVLAAANYAIEKDITDIVIGTHQNETAESHPTYINDLQSLISRASTGNVGQFHLHAPFIEMVEQDVKDTIAVYKENADKEAKAKADADEAAKEAAQKVAEALNKEKETPSPAKADEAVKTPHKARVKDAAKGE